MYVKDPPMKPSKLPQHPIWRGIGCIMMIVIPALSYLVASMLVDNRQDLPWLVIPRDLIFTQLKDMFLLVRVLYAGILALVIGGILALITFLINSLLGPSKYGPYDIPPEKVRKP
jgi:hypothetical protein